MFNFDYCAPERTLVHHAHAELLPCQDKCALSALDGGGTFRPLSRAHPFIVTMHTAFIDRMPILADAHLHYPEALPTIDMFGELSREPKTLFLVMKRCVLFCVSQSWNWRLLLQFSYRMTLREYLLTCSASKRARLGLIGQLFEALVFLDEMRVAHRDVKSDNVLVQFDDERQTPQLVLSDFGCAICAPLEIRFVDEFTDLGGNALLAAPEISRAKLVPHARLNFTRSDIWAAATLGIEIMNG